MRRVDCNPCLINKRKTQIDTNTTKTKNIMNVTKTETALSGENTETGTIKHTGYLNMVPNQRQ